MKIGVDTSVLAYAEGVNDADRKRISRTVLARLINHELTMPLHVAGELFHVLVKKKKLPPRDARGIVMEWQARFTDTPMTTDSVLESALDLAADHHLQIFDALVLSACAHVRCRMLLSEDMQDGFVWHGVTVVNPFASTPHPLLADLLRH